MKFACFFALAALTGATFPASAQAQPPAEAAAETPLTLGAWLARDQELGARRPVPDAQSAEFQAHYQAIRAGLAAGRAEYDADRAAGRSPRACLPPPGQSQIGSDEIGHWLYGRPVEDYGRSLTELIGLFLRERFPCPR